MPQIRIRVNADGTLSIVGEQFQGSACEQAIQPYLAALGIAPTDPAIERVYTEEAVQEDGLTEGE